MGRRLGLCRWFDAHLRLRRYILFIVGVEFIRDAVNNTRNPNLWAYDNPHRTVESNFQHRFFCDVWYGIVVTS
jgi:hypothetical protein